MHPAENGTHKGPTLYCRSQDGAYPVLVLPTGYRLDSPSGTRVFCSKRQLLIAVTGHPKARNWTFDRYFRQGKYRPPFVKHPSIDLLDYFAEPVVESSPAISVGTPTAAHLATKHLGIDLERRSGEVRKLLFAGFGSWIRSAGYDGEDVLQEVFKGLLIRNQGTCPWDVTKSSFGHYVHMVCHGVLSNWHRKVKRIRQHESPGLLAFNEHGTPEPQDAASANIADVPDPSDYEMHQVTVDLLGHVPNEPGTYLARRILPYVRDGHTPTDIARQLGCKRTQVQEALALLRHYAKSWIV